MKKILCVILCIILPMAIFTLSCFASYQPTMVFGPEHSTAITKSVQLVGQTPDTLVLQFQVKNPTNYLGELRGFSSLFGLTSDPLPPSPVFWENGRTAFWSGYLEFDFVIDNDSLALDSLSIQVYSLDELGNVRANDYCYVQFTTPPSIIFTAYAQSWVSATSYRGKISGVFGIGTYGLLFIINANDDDTDNTGTATIKIYLR